MPVRRVHDRKMVSMATPKKEPSKQAVSVGKEEKAQQRV